MHSGGLFQQRKHDEVPAGHKECKLYIFNLKYESHNKKKPVIEMFDNMVRIGVSLHATDDHLILLFILLLINGMHVQAVCAHAEGH